MSLRLEIIGLKVSHVRSLLTREAESTFKMDVGKGADLQGQWQELLKMAKKGNYDRVGKLAGRILHENPQDELAFRTKVICMLQSQQYGEALDHINKNSKLAINLSYEKAYCLYRLNRMKEAFDVLDSWNTNELRKQELMYQIYYRLDKFMDAYSTLNSLRGVTRDEMSYERSNNVAAIEAMLKIENIPYTVNEVDDDSYEIKYNRALGLIGEGKYVEAEKLLLDVEKEAISVLQEDGASDEDIADELGVILGLRGYCCQLLGRQREASKLYLDVLKTKPSDPGLSAVLSNNIICINKEKNLFDSKKRFKGVIAEDVNAKINDLQRRYFLFNQCLFYLYTSQPDACLSSCDKLEKHYPQYYSESMMIRAALTARIQGIEQTKKEMAQFFKSNPDSCISIMLGLAKISLKEKKVDDAINIFKSLRNEYFRCGIISALVTLFQSQGKSQEAAGILRDAVEHYKKSGANQDNLELLWRLTAQFMMNQGEYQEAAKSLEQLRKKSNDEITLAQLIVAYAKFDSEKAQKLSQLLPAEPTYAEINHLESPNWMANVKGKRPGKGVSESPVKHADAETPKAKKRTKKRKRSKRPQNYEEDRVPDPERWLPKYERSTYRPRRTKKGRVDVGKGTQGSDTFASAKYDMSEKVRSPRPGKSSDPSPSEASPGSWKSNKQKKKKGRSK